MSEADQWEQQFDDYSAHIRDGLDDEMALTAAVMALLVLATELAPHGEIGPDDFKMMVLDAVRDNLEAGEVTLQ